MKHITVRFNFEEDDELFESAGIELANTNISKEDRRLIVERLAQSDKWHTDTVWSILDALEA